MSASLFSLEFKGRLGILPCFCLLTTYYYEHITHRSFNSRSFADLGICHFNRAHAKNQPERWYGAALGGGAAESAFGSETNNILTKGTIYGIILFFLVALGLYLLYKAQSTSAAPEVDMNSLITSQEEPSVAETKIEAVESSDLGETSGDLVDTLEAGAAEAVDAASNDMQPVSN